MAKARSKTSSFVLIGAIAVVLLYALADPQFHCVDKCIYTHYTESVVDDLDLNVVNQIPRKEAWLLTKTYNYPDVHSNGVAVLWAPFFAAAKLVKANSGFDRKQIDRAAQALANLFWGLMALPLIWGLLRRFYDAKTAAATSCILLMTSPFLWHLIYQPENADVTSFFLSAALFWFATNEEFRARRWFPFWLGLALFTAMAVKFDAIFDGLLFAHFLFEQRKRGLRFVGDACAKFGFGGALAIVPMVTNESIKAGFLDYSYFDTVTSKIYVLYENLFAPSGYFVTQPFWLILIVAFALVSIRRRPSSLVWTAFAIPLTELLLESFNYNQNESFGARHWINNIPCWALVLASTLDRLKGSKWRRAVIAGGVCGAVVMVWTALLYRLDFNTYFFTGDWVHAFRQLDWASALFIVRMKSLGPKLALWFLLVPTVFVVVEFYLHWSKLSARAVAAGFAVLCAGYASVTSLNVMNNAKSAALVPKRVQQAVIGNGPEINMFFENAGCLQRAIKYYTRRGDFTLAQRREVELQDYVATVKKQILRDPIGFGKTLIPGRKTYVPDSLRTDE